MPEVDLLGPGDIPYDLKINKSELELHDDPLGEGGCGQVLRASHPSWGQVAYKRLITRNIQQETQTARKLMEEAKFLMEIRHPNIVQLFGITFEPKWYGLILEYMTYGSLDKFFEKCPGTDPYVKANFSRQISVGMTYLHTRHPTIVHRDLKISNVLITTGLHIKITDFGISAWREQQTRTRRELRRSAAAGTTTHVPPEVWRDVNTRPTEAFDVYAFGVLLWEVYSEKEPFQGVHTSVIQSCVERKQRPSIADVEDVMPRRIMSIMEQCWHDDPEQRPAFQDVKREFDGFCEEHKQEIEAATNLLMTRLHMAPPQSTQLPSVAAIDSGVATMSEAAGGGQSPSTDRSEHRLPLADRLGSQHISPPVASENASHLSNPLEGHSVEPDSPDIYSASSQPVSLLPSSGGAAAEAAAASNSSLNMAPSGQGWSSGTGQPTQGWSSGTGQPTFSGQGLSSPISQPPPTGQGWSSTTGQGWSSGISQPLGPHGSSQMSETFTKATPIDHRLLSSGTSQPTDDSAPHVSIPGHPSLANSQPPPPAMLDADLTHRSCVGVSIDVSRVVPRLAEQRRTTVDSAGGSRDSTTLYKAWSDDVATDAAPTECSSTGARGDAETAHLPPKRASPNRIQPAVNQGNVDQGSFLGNPVLSGSHQNPPTGGNRFAASSDQLQPDFGAVREVDLSRFQNHVRVASDPYVDHSGAATGWNVPSHDVPRGGADGDSRKASAGEPKKCFPTSDKPDRAPPHPQGHGISIHRADDGGNVELSGCIGVQVGNNNFMNVEINGQNPAMPRINIKKGKFSAKGAKKKSQTKEKETLTITNSLKVLNDENIDTMSRNVGDSWKNLARELGFSEGEIDALQYDNHIHGLQEIIRQMLHAWRERHGPQHATLCALADALIRVSKAKVAALLHDY